MFSVFYGLLWIGKQGKRTIFPLLPSPTKESNAQIQSQGPRFTLPHSNAQRSWHTFNTCFPSGVKKKPTTRGLPMRARITYNSQCKTLSAWQTKSSRSCVAQLNQLMMHSNHVLIFSSADPIKKRERYTLLVDCLPSMLVCVLLCSSLAQHQNQTPPPTKRPNESASDSEKEREIV
jgi:hypothetical protein